MREFGQTIKEIRKNKGMTLKEAAGDILSTAQLSRFENGKSQISAQNFYFILQNLSITNDEFQCILEDDREKRQFLRLGEISDYLNNRDFDKLENIRKEIIENSYDPHSWEYFQLQLIELVLERWEKGKANGEPVRQYLIQVDNWGEYELQLFTIFTFSLDVELAYQLSQTALRKAKKYLVIPNARNLFFNLMINHFYHYIDNDRLDYAQEMLDLMDNSLHKTRDIANHVLFMVMTGALAYKKEEIDSGRELFRKAIDYTKEFRLSELEENVVKEFAFWEEYTNNKEVRCIKTSADFINKYNS